MTLPDLLGALLVIVLGMACGAAVSLAGHGWPL